jgi:hypothetical protein
MANGCGNSSLVQCSGHLDYNVYVENVNNPEHSAGNEVWGDNNTTANYNLFQGYLAGAGGAIDWSQSGNFTFNNNIFNMYSGSGTNCATQGGGYWNNEGGNSPAYTPKSCTGNTYSNAGTGTYRSATPTISPVSGIFAGTQTVTLTNTGTNRDANTTIWYTTDGSSPVPGTAQHASSGGTITLTSSATIKAVGMWGAPNQPTSYPAGLGYVPSGMVSAIYTASGVTPVRPVTPVPPVTPVTPVAPGTPTLTSAYLETPNNVNTMVIGGTLQFGVLGIYGTSTVSVSIPASQVVWSSSNPAVLRVDGTGKVTAVGSGKANVQDQIGTVTGGAWTITIPPAAKAAAVPAGPGAALADIFHGPFWRLETPVGGSASISNSHLFLGVPGGANHDPLLPSNQAVRVVQTIGMEDFDVAIKIDSPLFATDGNTSQGLMILSGSKDFITFALTTDGTKIGLNARTVTGGAATTVLNDTDFSQYQNPMYLRVTKAGNAYVAFYSVDGANWTQAASFPDDTNFSSIGPFASNYSSTPANAAPVVMSVNWFDVQQ